MFNKKQAILFLTQAYPDFEGSCRGIFIRNHVDDLVSHGYFITVVTPRIYKKSKKKEKLRNVFIYRFYFSSGEKPLISFKKIPILLMMIYMISCFLKMFEVMVRHSCQLIHVHWIHPNGFIGLIAKLVFRKPMVVHVRGSDFNLFASRNRFFKILTRLVLEQSNFILCTSERAKFGIINSFSKLNPQKVVVVYNKVDSSRFHPLPENEVRQTLGIPQKGICMLFAGNLVPEKGILELIETFKILAEKFSEKDFFLYAVGDGPLKDVILEKAGPKSRISIQGPVSPDVMPLWFNASNLLILPSEREGTPNVVLEALCCGIPVFATDVGDVAKFVKNGENGFVVPVERKKEALYTILSDILSYPKDLMNMKIRLQHKTLNTQDYVTKDVADIYNILLQKKKKKSHA